MARAVPGAKAFTYVFGVIGLAVSLGLVAAQTPPTRPAVPPGTTPPAIPPGTAPVPPAAGHPMDQPIAWLLEARRNFTAVRDYSGTMIKRERVKGVLQDENIILLTAKNQPFSVYMRWLAPKRFAGQEVAYVQGKNAGKMRVQLKGLIGGVAGFVNIDTNDRRVMDHSRHTIVEAGIGNLIETCLQSYDTDRRVNKTQVRTGEFDYNKRRVLRIEATRPQRGEGAYCYRSLLYLDKDSKIPVRMENYDWPVQGGSPDGELLEMFSYVDLRFNTGVNDEFFVK